MTYVIIFQQSW